MENINMCGSVRKLNLSRCDFDAVLLDFDGTIVPSEKVFFYCWQKEFKSNYNCAFSEDEYIRYELNRDAELINYLKDTNRLVSKIAPKLLMENVYNSYSYEFQHMLEDNDFSKQLTHISQWKNEGIKLGIVSTSRRKYIEMFFEKYIDYKNLFSCVLCREDVEKLKPDPMVYLLAADQLRVTPSRCLVIEDSLKGIEGALSAQMKAIRVLENTFDVDTYTWENRIPTMQSIVDVGFF